MKSCYTENLHFFLPAANSFSAGAAPWRPRLHSGQSSRRALQQHRHRGDTELLSPGPGTVHPGRPRVTRVRQWTEHRTPSHTGGELRQWPEQQLCPGTVARPQRAAVTALQNLSTEWVLPVHPALLPRTPNHICSHPRICIFQTP